MGLASPTKLLWVYGFFKTCGSFKTFDDAALEAPSAGWAYIYSSSLNSNVRFIQLLYIEYNYCTFIISLSFGVLKILSNMI